MLGKIDGRKRRGRQRMRWLNGITDFDEFEQTPEDSEKRKPGMLQFMGSQRVGYDLVIEQQQCSFLKL